MKDTEDTFATFFSKDLIGKKILTIVSTWVLHDAAGGRQLFLLPIHRFSIKESNADRWLLRVLTPISCFRLSWHFSKID